jgi:hypothetical protein
MRYSGVGSICAVEDLTPCTARLPQTAIRPARLLIPGRFFLTVHRWPLAWTASTACSMSRALCVVGEAARQLRRLLRIADRARRACRAAATCDRPVPGSLAVGLADPETAVAARAGYAKRFSLHRYPIIATGFVFQLKSGRTSECARLPQAEQTNRGSRSDMRMLSGLFVAPLFLSCELV